MGQYKEKQSGLLQRKATVDACREAAEPFARRDTRGCDRRQNEGDGRAGAPDRFARGGVSQYF
jgi:hypothetical protein